MSDQAIPVAAEAALPIPPASAEYPKPNDKGVFEDQDCQTIFGPVLNGVDAMILLVEQADGWRSGCSVLLGPEHLLDSITIHQTPYPTRSSAIVAVGERIVAWSGEQKDRGGKKQRRRAEDLQAWALEVEKKEAPPEAAANGTPIPVTPESTGEQPDGERLNTKEESPVHTSALSTGELRMVPLADLYESPLNPRKYFAEGPMAELVESIKARGVRTPIIARPNGEKLEIAAGARRYRASLTAGLAEVPVIVRPMSEEEFLEIISFENCQREDPHPLDEAQGFKVYMEHSGKGLAGLIEKSGVSRSQVFSRLKLLELVEEGQKALWDERITAGHAILIARRKPEIQRLALRDGCFERFWEPRSGNSFRLRSVREFARWLAEECEGAMLDKAPFDREDIALLPQAGNCTACEKRTDDLCSDRACYEAKVEAHVARESAKGLVAISTDYDTKAAPAGVVVSREFVEVEEDEPDDPEGAAERAEFEESGVDPKPALVCTSAETAVVAHGRDRGKTVHICRDLKCPVHGSDLKWQMEAASRRGSAPDKPKDFWAERAEALPKKIEWESRVAILKAVLAEPFDWKIPHEQLQLLAQSLLPHSITEEFIRALNLPCHDVRNFSYKNGWASSADFAKMIQAPQGSPASYWLPRITFGLSMHDASKEWEGNGGAHQRMLRAAKALRIDVEAIKKATADRINADFKARRDKAKGKMTPEPKASAKPEPTRKAVVKKLPALNQAPSAKKAAPQEKPAPVKKSPAKKAPVKKAVVKKGKK